MVPCDACGCHVRISDQCPVCGVVTGARATAVALLLGLGGCVGETKTSDSGTGSSGVDYGTSVSDADTDIDTDTDTDTAHTGSLQVDYGVPTHTGDSGN